MKIVDYDIRQKKLLLHEKNERESDGGRST